ncbi:hypothetical protein DFH07DRAFT_971050 [Mycena maculata]|uniref:CxC2-like cysteine cluster KDZ transposase-associated domain-containing protein n=1 Tax=Mycena maculata TaxID=230809 RepID=A0AAD7HQA2_9AGAR|nr:hypothetical protein DFH07DRAFT_971050 [Mycena maculata]
MGKRRRKNFSGEVDQNNDEDDREVHIDASVSTGAQTVQTNVSMLEPSSKKTKILHVPSPPSAATPEEEEEEEDKDEDEEDTGRKQGASVMMRAFLKETPAIEEAIFRTRTHAQLHGKNPQIQCACGQPASFRCPECGVTDMVCAECVIKMHPCHQMHHIEQWDGTAFVRTSLITWGHVVNLGHGGKRCKNAGSEDQGRKSVIVDTNGIHFVCIVYCACGETVMPDPIQLIGARLFPATLDTPKTAFTFEVMHNFHVHNLTSKKTASDYYRALQKLTNGAFPNQVPDRVREFLWVVRVWRHLVMRRRSGQAQGIDSVITNRRENSLAVRCPSCPEVGFNVDKATIEAAPRDKKHLYTLFLSSDGNFKLQRKKKVDDPDDVALNGGAAYFPDNKIYRDYISKLKPSDDFACKISPKSKNSVITGVVACQCARHGFFMPGGMVDLTKGEGYGHTDFALSQALGDAQDQRWVVLTYDVYCQYFKNITMRFETWFPSLSRLIKKLGGAVPKMHIRNHIGQCQSQWSMNFQEYLAFLIRELIEGSWAELNQFAGSTKEQNHGHRHDSIDDGCGQWNWDKVIGMADMLLKLYLQACAAVRKRSPLFEALTESTDKQLIAEWSKMSKKWTIKDGKYSSPYDAKIDNPPPTHRSAYEKLITAELWKSIAQGVVCKGETEFISRGLKIETEQHRINMILKISATDQAIRAKANLQKELTSWRITQHERFPSLQSLIEAEAEVAPEKQKLFLPSTFNEHTRAAHGMSQLSTIEFGLREGQAHDALGDVRHAIKTFNFNIAYKIQHVDGQRIVAADEYRRARTALVLLGLDPIHHSLKPLHNEELYAKNTRDSPKMGESGDVDPWFWTVGRPNHLTAKEEQDWSMEMDSIKWFRDRANHDRAVEQKELVDVEFGRSETHSGERAYAHLKDLMYTKLATDCIKVHLSAPQQVEEERKAEEEEALAELTRKGLSDTTALNSWKDGILIDPIPSHPILSTGDSQQQGPVALDIPDYILRPS